MDENKFQTLEFIKPANNFTQNTVQNSVLSQCFIIGNIEYVSSATLWRCGVTALHLHLTEKSYYKEFDMFLEVSDESSVLL